MLKQRDENGDYRKSFRISQSNRRFSAVIPHPHTPIFVHVAFFGFCEVGFFFNPFFLLVLLCGFKSAMRTFLPALNRRLSAIFHQYSRK